MNLLRPLVFDLDGTLIDSRRDIAAACNYALDAVGREKLPVEAITCHVGNGARALLKGVLGPEAQQVDFTELVRHFQAYYLEHPTDNNRLMPGAAECLKLRSERKLALCTNKPHHLTMAVLRGLGWTDLFDVVIAPVRGDPLKPDGAPLLKVAAQLAIEPSRLIMIGDGPQDVGAGKAVDAYTIGLKGGFLPLPLLLEAGPDALLDSLLELPGHLSSF